MSSASGFFFSNWAEFFFCVLLVFGILIAFLSPSAFVTYVVVFLSGMISGRLIYDRNHKMVAPYYLIITGLIVGFVIGTYYGSRVVVVILYVMGALLAYQLKTRGIVKDVMY